MGESLKEAREGVSGSRRSEFEMRKGDCGAVRKGFPREAAKWTDRIEGVRDPGVIWSRALR